MPTDRPLTTNERLVLRLVAAGLAVREIGISLGWTSGRVQAHITSAMVALGARSRLEAVDLAVQRGEI